MLIQVKETVKSKNVLSTDIPEQATVHSSSNIDFDHWLQISDTNDLDNKNSGPSSPIMKVDIMYYRFTLLSLFFITIICVQELFTYRQLGTQH